MTEQDKYQIKVRGWIGQRWANWFDGMAMTYQGTEDESSLTVLTGPLADQAALRGILSRIWDLNLCLLSVIRVETGSE